MPDACLRVTDRVKHEQKLTHAFLPKGTKNCALLDGLISSEQFSATSRQEPEIIQKGKSCYRNVKLLSMR